MESFRQIFKLIFVIFFLYLLGDIFFRWDGFRYYASFSEFIPSVALISSLWAVVVLFTALILWMLLITFRWCCLKINWKVNASQWLLFIGLFVFACMVVWIIKKMYWPHLITTRLPLLLKMSVAFAVTCTALMFSWLFHTKAEKWMNVIQERITPLIWLFGLLVLSSIPLVAYHAFTKQDNKTLQKVTHVAADKNRPNIILVIFDALTARNMSLYGYHRPNTPFINKWAKNASVFERVQSEGNITTPTTASIMTGKRLWTHQTYQVAGSSKPVRGNSENLPLLLKENGYYTSAFVVNSYASVKKLDMVNSFHLVYNPTKFNAYVGLRGAIEVFLYRLFGDKIRLHNWIVKKDFILYKFLNILYGKVSVTEVPPERAFNVFLSDLESKITEPYFAWVHLLPPHDPYLPPEPFMGKFDRSGKMNTFKSQENLVKWWYPYQSKGAVFPETVKPDVETLRARYDEFIMYCDKQFQSFIDKLSKSKKLDNTIIIFTSDHGESFEHNYLKHGFQYLYEQVTHIPLIIKEPGQKSGMRINDLAEQIDIPVTILDLAGIPVPTWMEGRSLTPLLKGETLPPKTPISMALEGQSSRSNKITQGTFAVWENNYKLIHYLSDGKSQLFDLENDPDELNNIIKEEPDLLKNMLDIILHELENANERIKTGK